MDNINISNYHFLKEWISLNPNFVGLEYSTNNYLISGKVNIFLKDFLVEELLNNEYFKNNIYSMSKEEFINIIKIHVQSQSLLNSSENNLSENLNINNSDYIRKISINDNSKALIITSSGNNLVINNVPYSKVVSVYSDEVEKCNYYVPVKYFLSKIIDSDKIKYFELINSSKDINIEQLNYLRSFEKFMGILLKNEDKIIGSAKDLLDMYKRNLFSLSLLENLNSNQKKAVNTYYDIINSYIDSKNKETEKEEQVYNRSSVGYSSLALLLSVIFIAGFAIAFLILFT